MDCAAEALTFHLAIIARQKPHADNHSPDIQCVRWIQVWRVTTEVDTHGYVKGLTSELLSSFREEYEPSCISFRLQAQHVAYSLCYPRTQFGPINNKIIIVDWTTCKPISLTYTRKIIPDYAIVSDSPSFMVLVILMNSEM
jgi:hypothetical protein